MKTKDNAAIKSGSGKPKMDKRAGNKIAKPPTESALRDTEKIAHFLERISDGFVAFDTKMNYVYVNRRGGELLGRRPEDLIGKNYWEEYPEAVGTPFANAYVRALETQSPVEFEDYYEPWDRWFENRIYPDQYGLSIFFSDVTKRKHAEDKIKYLTRLYAMLSQINQAIVRIKDRQELFERVCQVAVKFGQFHTAWVGLTEPDGGKVRIVASDGEGQKYVQQININLENEISRRGPTGSAIRKNIVVLVNDVKTDVRMGPWREAVMQQGYRSLAAVPICTQGKVIGVFDLYATEVNFFTADELSLLEEIGTNIAFALDVMLVEEERQRAHQKLETHIQRLSTLRAIDSAISSGLDLRLFLDMFVQRVIVQSGVDAAAIWTFHPTLNQLEFATGRGFYHYQMPRLRMNLRDHGAGQAVLERTLIYIPRLSEIQLPIPEAKQMSEERFVSYYAVPLITKGEVKGVLELYQRSFHHPDSEWLDFVQTLASQSAIAIADAELFNNLQRSNFELLFAYDETIEGWSRALDLRDKETVGHTQRVAATTLRLAARMGVSETDLVHMRRGALLHDIGKMGIPDAILLKSGPLTEEEWGIMRRHPQFAYDMLSPIRYLQPALDIPYCHHEKWDGTGYPRGLKGDQIPLSARIFAVVDIWDALTSDRPYRTAWPKEKALEYIRTLNGSHLDPRVVEAFLTMPSEEDLRNASS
ncbi:MAG TPA: HD domain-containing phosphohydrolase [Anaerolineales bacterium]|nr:HD domain-containing phosphohydrolase [Anaerolineales bacterium]